MGVVPDTKIGKVEFYELHATPWVANAVAIGLTTAEANNIALLATNARDAYNQQKAAQEAAKAATQQFDDAVRTLQRAGAEAIRKIRVKAETTPPDPGVYVLAQIPAPAAPAPVPPPGTPFDFRVELLQTGALVLSWKCNNPAGSVGTIYEVRRRTAPGGAFDYVGASGVRNFTDETLPPGGGTASAVTYQVQAVRSTRRGNPAQFTVTIGTAGGTATATVVATPKLAA